MLHGVRQFILPFYFLCCILLGGSSTAPWPNMVLQVGAVAILCWAALACPRYKAGGSGSQLAVIISAMVGLILLQTIPLPPSLWSALPGRDFIAHGFDLLGQPQPWLPLSLAPYDTLVSSLWLLPPLAILAGVLRLAAFREHRMGIAVVLASLVGVILGALQVTGGGKANSGWYVYEVTNPGAAVGFFANANHMAILLAATLPFLVALYGERRGQEPPLRTQAAAGTVALLGGAMTVVLVGIALNGSLAGLALGAIVLAASAFIRMRLDQPRARWGLAAVGLGALAAIALLVASPLHNNLTNAGVETDYSSRYTSFANSLRATAEYFPIGSGVGSFVKVYPAYENPAWVDRWYVNHVHNDYIEVALETGLPGILLMAAFVLWWTQRAIVIWRAPTVDHFARAATIASAAILLHSLVDFPIRTASISTLFAFCIAFMVGVRRRSLIEPTVEANLQGTRHLSVP